MESKLMTNSYGQATARASSNIAFIKYWGNVDDQLRLPVNPSLSMNLKDLYTETRVIWDTELAHDTLTLNEQPASEKAVKRVSQFLDKLRPETGIKNFAQVESINNFPMGAGIASSAAAFAALTVAAVAAAGLELPERELTTLARLGSGSASRSIPTGFVEWHTGKSHAESYAESIAQPDHWGLVDVIAIVSKEHKKVGSYHGHSSASTSDLQKARVAGAAKRLETCKQALFEHDFATFAEVVELDSNLMHAVMMTSQPPLFYWLPATLTLMDNVRKWRTEGISVCYTLDAGPNVHCICTKDCASDVSNRLQNLSGVVDVIVSEPGGAASLISAGD
jgi:diphosphomevalonate decarboxylase